MAVDIPGQQELMQIVGTCTAGNFSVVLQKNEFREEGIPELFSSFVKIISPISAYGEEVAKQNTDKESGYPDSRMRKYIDKQIVQCFFAFILALSGYAVVGYILLVIILKIYYRFI